MGRSDEEVAELEVTDNEICRTITENRPKQLSPLYAVLNKIAVVNWVPTTHSSNVAKELA
ncbi:envelope-like protein, partial [Trifolium medium]|nr:envelope-like protein [Trifolium medium]